MPEGFKIMLACYIVALAWEMSMAECGIILL